MAFPASVSPVTPGGDSFTVTTAYIQYYAGSPGSSYLPVGTTCPESQAAGGAVAYVGSDKKCQGVQGLRITIGDTMDSIHSGFEMTNFNFHCNGTQSSISASWALNGPIVE
jgi:hypothetical protein